MKRQRFLGVEGIAPFIIWFIVGLAIVGAVFVVIFG